MDLKKDLQMELLAPGSPESTTLRSESKVQLTWVLPHWLKVYYKHAALQLNRSTLHSQQAATQDSTTSTGTQARYNNRF